MKFYDQAFSKDPRANFANQGVGAMHGANGARGAYDRSLGQQEEALGMFRAQALGQGPSQAQAMLQQAGERNQAQAAQLAASGRGGNVQGAMRSAQAAQLAANAQTQQQAAMLAAQEQQAGMQGFASLSGDLSQQALGQQEMYLGQQQALLGMQLQDDIARREAAQRAREWRSNRNLGWTRFGTETGMGVLEGVLGGLG